MEAASRALEHGTSRGGRWLRVRRFQLALWIAAAEAIALVLGLIPRWPAFAAALLLIAFHVLVGRRLSLDSARQASSVAATSQVLVGLLPIFLLLLGALALAALVAVVAVALVVIVAARR